MPIMNHTEQASATLRVGDRIQVLVADRNAHYRETIRRVLDRYANSSVVAEACTLIEAATRAMERSPDLVLLDFDLVAHEKVARLRKLAQTFPDLRVVVLLDEDSPDYRRAVQDRWGYLCVAKDRVEEHLAWIIADIKPVAR
jgi:DNA-binding NarL/FixJ family response regulator